MMHPTKLLLAAALAIGVAHVPTLAQAESAKSEAGASKKSQPASDDFEENRRAHMEKSKENNAKKGAN